MAAIIPAGSLTLDRGDPRAKPKSSIAFRTYEERISETDVSFEEFLYYASITRAEEKLADERYRVSRGPTTVKSTIKDRFQKGSTDQEEKTYTGASAGENGARQQPGQHGDDIISENERRNASRAMRTAGWGSVFYLITTDILGPFQTPWSFAQMGYGPGFALYTVFGILSAYSGWILWRIFIELDSDRYPMRNYADIFMRLFGPGMKHFVNVAQTIQLLSVLGFLILLNGQSISQISQGPPDQNLPGVCFIACLVIFTCAGFVLGQIRTFQRLSWLANLAIWINLVGVVMVVVLASRFPPNFAAVQATFGPQWEPGPILTFAGTPPDGFATGGTGFIASINGLNQVMLVYGGAALFVFFMAEMRHPPDFWKSLICAQAFIYGVYIIHGMVVYHFQGQYAFSPSQQGISEYHWQTALNAITLISGLIACALYGNIGMKIAYYEVFEPLLHFPPLKTTGGKIWWAVLIPVYWILCFIVAASIPQLALMSSLIGAIFVGGFTYICPAMAALGHWIRRDAIIPEFERFDPSTRTFSYVDRGFRRYWRGFMKHPFLNTWNFIYLLGSLVTCGLGCYSAIIALMAAFQSGVATSFSCNSPV